MDLNLKNWVSNIIGFDQQDFWKILVLKLDLTSKYTITCDLGF
ncbi:MAG: hypothetical protein BAJALOKI2v1_210023 [Promethearchaeota archaeon]|nr:MAG: hypothetical protein BAJALOKI2v1_210023 [Candidatus Lokiarchaeota archaeon]